MLAVDKELDRIGIPRELEDVIGVGERSVVVGAADAISAGVAGPVDGAVDGVDVASNEFHNVDFAAVGPSDRPDVGTEHPDCGPDTQSRGSRARTSTRPYCFSYFPAFLRSVVICSHRTTGILDFFTVYAVRFSILSHPRTFRWIHSSTPLLVLEIGEPGEELGPDSSLVIAEVQVCVVEVAMYDTGRVSVVGCRNPASSRVWT